MNLAVLMKSRRAPTVGDIFAMLPPDNLFLFGRVIDTNASPLGVGGAILIYIYRIRARVKLPAPPELCRDELLIPPVMTNRLPWSRGYFEFVEHRQLASTDVLPQHCFKNFRGWYLDERGARLPGPVEPVGEFGLGSYRTIDDDISRALGLPLAPDE